MPCRKPAQHAEPHQQVRSPLRRQRDSGHRRAPVSVGSPRRPEASGKSPLPCGVGPADTIGHGKPRSGDEGTINGAGKTLVK
jgi:hypothetical protein